MENLRKSRKNRENVEKCNKNFQCSHRAVDTPLEEISKILQEFHFTQYRFYEGSVNRMKLIFFLQEEIHSNYQVTQIVNIYNSVPANFKCLIS